MDAPPGNIHLGVLTWFATLQEERNGTGPYHRNRLGETEFLTLQRSRGQRGQNAVRLRKSERHAQEDETLLAPK